MSIAEKEIVLAMGAEIAKALMGRGWPAAYVLMPSRDFGWYAPGFEDQRGRINPHIIVSIDGRQIAYATPDNIESGVIELSGMLDLAPDEHKMSGIRINGGNVERIVQAIDRLRWVIGIRPNYFPGVSLAEAGGGLQEAMRLEGLKINGVWPAIFSRIDDGEIGFGEYEPPK